MHESYDALLADPAVDAVYIPLPNGLHGRWTVRALDAGQARPLPEKLFHCEERRARAAEVVRPRTGQRARSWILTPSTRRLPPGRGAHVVEILRSGELGTLTHAEASVCFPLLKRGDIRFRRDLAGGALMDAGCYAVNFVRTAMAEEPSVTSAACDDDQRPASTAAHAGGLPQLS